MNCKLLLSSVCLVFFGCMDVPDAVPIDAVGQTVLVSNYLSVNKLSMNKLSMNKLSMNKLSMNKLSMNRLRDGSLKFNTGDSEGLETTEEGREVLLYLVRCALSEGEELTVTYEGVTYRYQGLLGLAPAWANRALDEGEKRLVSACLLAHVNAYGISVSFSARSHGVLPADEAEQVAYPVYEGTFFGDVFVDVSERMKLYSCQGDEQHVALAQSSDRAFRVCADPSSGCGIESLGRCRDVCEDRSEEHGWRNCWADGTRYTETIGTFLPADLAMVDTCGKAASCVDAGALASPAGSAAILDCSHAQGCEASCGDSGTCTLDGTAAANFRAVALMSSTVDVSCLESGSCNVECKAGSDCEVDCKSADTCTGVQCEAGAACLLDCTDAASCSFLLCEDGETTCPGDIVVCGRACP